LGAASHLRNLPQSGRGFEGATETESQEMIPWHIGTARERRFLGLATNWLACRLEVMGGTVTGINHRPRYQSDREKLQNSLLGMADFAAEMRIEAKLWTPPTT
jgi:hypothetical protein